MQFCKANIHDIDIYLILDLAIAILHVFPNIPIKNHKIFLTLLLTKQDPVVILFKDDLRDTESIRMSV